MKHGRSLLFLVVLFQAGVSWAFAGTNGQYQPYLQIGTTGFLGNTPSRMSANTDFFIPLWQNQSSLLFSDIRLYGYNNNAIIGNFSFSFRHLIPNAKQIVGIHASFGHRKTNHGNHFNQLAIGGEYRISRLFLGTNFYKPIGTTKNSISDTVITAAGIGRHYEKALPGIDAEIGYDLTDNFSGYISGYYFKNSDHQNIYGPKASLTYDISASGAGKILKILDKIRLAGSIQKDKSHGTTGCVGINFRIGLLPNTKNSTTGTEKHMSNPIRSNPNIVTDTFFQVVTKPKPEAKELLLEDNSIQSSNSETAKIVDDDTATDTTEEPEVSMPDNTVEQDAQNTIVESAEPPEVSAEPTPVPETTAELITTTVATADPAIATDTGTNEVTNEAPGSNVLETEVADQQSKKGMDSATDIRHAENIGHETPQQIAETLLEQNVTVANRTTGNKTDPIIEPSSHHDSWSEVIFDWVRANPKTTAAIGTAVTSVVAVTSYCCWRLFRTKPTLGYDLSGTGGRPTFPGGGVSSPLRASSGSPTLPSFSNSPRGTGDFFKPSLATRTTDITAPATALAGACLLTRDREQNSGTETRTPSPDEFFPTDSTASSPNTITTWDARRLFNILGSPSPSPSPPPSLPSSRSSSGFSQMTQSLRISFSSFGAMFSSFSQQRGIGSRAGAIPSPRLRSSSDPEATPRDHLPANSRPRAYTHGSSSSMDIGFPEQAGLADSFDLSDSNSAASNPERPRTTTSKRSRLANIREPGDDPSIDQSPLDMQDDLQSSDFENGSPVSPLQLSGTPDQLSGLSDSVMSLFPEPSRNNSNNRAPTRNIHTYHQFASRAPRQSPPLSFFPPPESNGEHPTDDTTITVNLDVSEDESRPPSPRYFPSDDETEIEEDEEQPRASASNRPNSSATSTDSELNAQPLENLLSPRGMLTVTSTLTSFGKQARQWVSRRLSKSDTETDSKNVKVVRKIVE